MTKVVSRSSKQSGFTLLEAIVALTIIGITLVPVMGFLSEASRQLAVAADTTLRASAQQTVAAYIQSINPLLTPEGEDALSPQLTVRWIATPLVEPNTQSRLGGRLAGMVMGFYLIDITVLREGTEWFTFQTKRIGYRPSATGIDGTGAP